MSSEIGGVHKGWTVYGADGGKLGQVDEVQPTYLKLRQGFIFKKDVYVPAAAVSRLRGDEVHLSVPVGEVEALGWDTPPSPERGGPARPWVTIERVEPDAETAPLLDRIFAREALRIPIRAERVSVEKTPVIVGEVAITKEQVTERERVDTTVRSVDVEVEQVADATRAGETRAGSQRLVGERERGGGPTA